MKKYLIIIMCSATLAATGCKNNSSSQKDSCTSSFSDAAISSSVQSEESSLAEIDYNDIFGSDSSETNGLESYSETAMSSKTDSSSDTTTTRKKAEASVQKNEHTETKTDNEEISDNSQTTQAQDFEDLFNSTTTQATTKRTETTKKDETTKKTTTTRSEGGMQAGTAPDDNLNWGELVPVE